MPDAFDFGAFYSVSEAFSPGALRLEVALPEDVDPVALTRGEWVPETPLHCECDEGTRHLDLVGTTHAVLDIASWKVLELFAEKGFSGWGTYAIEITCQGRRIDGYEGLSTLGRCGPVHHNAVMLPPMAPGGESVEGWRGMFFDPETWDGSDIFSPEDTAHCIVTQHVKQALEEARATNWFFVALPDWEMVSAD